MSRRVSVADLAAAEVAPERTLYRWIAEDRLTVVYRPGRAGHGRVAMLDPHEVDQLLAMRDAGRLPHLQDRRVWQ